MEEAPKKKTDNKVNGIRNMLAMEEGPKKKEEKSFVQVEKSPVPESTKNEEVHSKGNPSMNHSSA